MNMFPLRTVSDVCRGSKGFRSHGSPPAAQGFTLLEVMIAVSIIALVFVSVFRMVSGTVRLAQAGRFNTMAPVLASQVLGQIELDLEDFTQTSGDFGEDQPGYKWTCSISEQELDLDALDFIDKEKSENFKKIVVTVMDNQEERKFEVTTWRYVFEE